MANLFQILSNGLGNAKNTVQNSGLFNILASQQYDNNGNVDYEKTLNVRQNTTPLNFKEKLFGRNMTMDEQKINPENGEAELVTHSNYKPGLFNDITSGYQENRTTPISLNNFGQNSGKGFAYRLGEGLGSVARIGESPLGRGLLTGAAISLLGGSPAQALAYGGTATALNQGNRGRDALYRQQLQKEGIDTSGISGYITDNTYKSMLEAKQLKDNAEYRNTYLKQQKIAQDEAREDRKLERELKRQENAANRALTMRGQDMSYDSHMANLELQREKLAQAEKAKRNANEYGDIQTQLDNFANMFETVNNPYRYRVFGGASEALNTLTRDEANFNAQRTLLFNQIARKLSGEKGVLSDKDIARVEAALPSLSDNLEQKRAKMKAIYALLDIKQGSANQAVNNIQNTIDDNPLGLDL